MWQLRGTRMRFSEPEPNLWHGVIFASSHGEIIRTTYGN